MIYEKLSFDNFVKIIKSFELYLSKKYFNEIFLVQTPVLYGKYFDENLDYLLRWNYYKSEEMYISSVIDLKGNPLDRLSSRKQRYLKKLNLIKPYRLEWNNDYESFYPILIKNKERHGVKPTHTLNELLDLKKRFPIFERNPNLVFFDTAASALKVDSMINAITNPKSPVASAKANPKSRFGNCF